MTRDWPINLCRYVTAETTAKVGDVVVTWNSTTITGTVDAIDKKRGIATVTWETGATRQHTVSALEPVSS